MKIREKKMHRKKGLFSSKNGKKVNKSVVVISVCTMQLWCGQTNELNFIEESKFNVGRDTHRQS